MAEEGIRTRTARERKEATSPRKPEQESDEEPKNVKDLVMQERNKELMIRTLEENEEHRRIIESTAEGSDAEMERTLQNYRTAGREVLGCEQSQHMEEMLEWGFRCAVDAGRERRQAEQNAGQEQEKKASFRDEEQSEEEQAQTKQEEVRPMNHEEQDMTMRLEENVGKETTREGEPGLIFS